jgi:hypothetical protein
MLTLLCKLVGQRYKKPIPMCAINIVGILPIIRIKFHKMHQTFYAKLLGIIIKHEFDVYLYTLLSSSSPQSMESCANLFGIIIRSQLAWNLPSYYSSRNQHTPPTLVLHDFPSQKCWNFELLFFKLWRKIQNNFGIFWYISSTWNLQN